MPGVSTEDTVATPEAPPATPGAGRSTGSRLRSRAFWVISDQAISSLANAGLTIVLARTVSPGEYGAFALAFSVYSLVVSVAQAVSGQVVVIRYSGEDPRTLGRAGAAAGGAAVLVGALCAAVACVVALFAGTPLREVLLVVGLLLPALVLQDTWRVLFTARGTPRQAFTNDLLWILLQAAGIAVLLAVDVSRSWPYVAVWAGAALSAALWGIRQAGSVPTFRTAPAWFRGHREVSLPSLANALAILGTTQIAFVLIAALGAVEDVGALRAAQTLLGPLNIVGFAASSFAVPEIVRRDLGRAGLVRAAVALSAVLVVVDAAWGAVLLLLPDSVGTALLGETWTNARSALPAMIAFTCLIGATVGASAVMRALNRADSAFYVSAMLGPLVLVLSVLGVELGGAAGAAAGFALAAALVVPPAWYLLARATRLGRREVPAEPGLLADDDTDSDDTDSDDTDDDRVDRTGEPAAGRGGPG